MRASTFFALFIAILLGFAFLGAVRYFNLLDTKGPEAPKTVIKPAYPRVLVARKNLYKGYALSTGDVLVRELRPEEKDLIAEFNKSPGTFVSPTVEAAAFRIMTATREAGHVLRKDDLEAPEIPPGLQPRITPKMQALSLLIPKNSAGGGLIRVDDYVDVYLTSAISGDKDGNPGPRTACIAREVCVILKRSNLFPQITPLPEGNAPLEFMLEANPYRAALLAFAQDKGNMILVPTSKKPRSEEGGKLSPPATFDIPGSKEYANEDQRVAAVLGADRAVTEADLERIFGLPPLPVLETLRIESLSGNKMQSPYQFVKVLGPNDRPAFDADRPGFGYHFSKPGAPTAESSTSPSAVTGTTTQQVPITRPAPQQPKSK